MAIVEQELKGVMLAVAAAMLQQHWEGDWTIGQLDSNHTCGCLQGWSLMSAS
jgi:hypothetical protein